METTLRFSFTFPPLSIPKITMYNTLSLVSFTNMLGFLCYDYTRATFNIDMDAICKDLALMMAHQNV